MNTPCRFLVPFNTASKDRQQSPARFRHPTDCVVSRFTGRLRSPLRIVLLCGVWLAAISANIALGQGALTNGAIYTGTILANTTNSYTFTAATGDSLVVRDGLLTASGFFNPWLRLYGPDGALVGRSEER